MRLAFGAFGLVDGRLLFPLCLLLPVSTPSGAPRRDSLGALDLDQAVAYAVKHHPTLQVEAATEEMMNAQVAISRTGYLPSLDLSAQVNVGTGNVLRGALFPMREIPSVSGPPTGRGLSDSAWGSAIGAGFSWDAVGLLRQMAQVDAALAEEARARASSDVVRLAVAYA